MPDPIPQLLALADAAEASLVPVDIEAVIALDAMIIDMSGSSGENVDVPLRKRQPPPRRSRRLGAAAAVGFLLIGAGWVATRSRQSPDGGAAVSIPAAAGQSDAAEQPNATELSDAAEQPNATGQSDAVEASAVVDRPVVLRNDGSAIGEQLAALELPGYLIALVDGRPLVYDLATGDEIDAPDARRLDFSGAVTTEGIVHQREIIDDSAFNKYTYHAVFSPWKGDDVPLALAETEGLAYVVHDDDVGLVAVVGTALELFLIHGRAEQYFAIRIDTGERKPLDLAPAIAGRVLWDRLGDSAATSYRRRLGFEQGGEIYNWTWVDGWTSIARGDALVDTGRHRIIEFCDGPLDCTRELVTHKGVTIADLSDQTPLASVFAASSEAGRFVELATGVQRLRVIDPTGEAAIYDLPAGSVFHRPLWIGEDRILLYGPRSTPLLYELTTQRGIQLDFLVRAAGNQPSFIWLPELVGIDDE